MMTILCRSCTILFFLSGYSMIVPKEEKFLQNSSMQTFLASMPKPVTLVLQPANNPFETNFSEWLGANASQHITEVVAMAWTRDGGDLFARGAFKFDLSGIPANAFIVSARLSLYSNPSPLNGDHVHANAGDDNAIWIRRLKSAWTLSTPWKRQPATDVSTQVLIPHTISASKDLVDVNVQNMVNDMLKKGNYGFMIGLQREYAYAIRNFASSLSPVAAKRPRLVIEYE